MCIISNMLLTFYYIMTFIYIFYIFLTRIISILINIQLSLVFLNIQKKLVRFDKKKHKINPWLTAGI